MIRVRPDTAVERTRRFIPFKQFKHRAFARPGVKAAYDSLAEEFAFLDEVLNGWSAPRGLPTRRIAVVIAPAMFD